MFAGDAQLSPAHAGGNDQADRLQDLAACEGYLFRPQIGLLDFYVGPKVELGVIKTFGKTIEHLLPVVCAEAEIVFDGVVNP